MVPWGFEDLRIWGQSSKYDEIRVNGAMVQWGFEDLGSKFKIWWNWLKAWWNYNQNMMKLGSNMMKLVKSTNGFKRIQIYDETSSIFYPPRSTSRFHAPLSLNKQLHTTTSLLTYIFSFLFLLIFTKAYVVLSWCGIIYFVRIGPDM